jgi:hypothetical protein
MAEFWRALKTLKALQAEQAVDTGPALDAHPLQAHSAMPAARAPLARRPQPDEPERAAPRRLEYVIAEPVMQGRTLHEPAAPWLPNEPDAAAQHAPASLSRTDPGRTSSSIRAEAGEAALGSAEARTNPKRAAITAR